MKPEEYIREAETKLGKGFFVAAFSDAYVVDQFGEGGSVLSQIEERIEKLLELRMFNEDAEYKAIRTDIGREFRFRSIDDTAEERDCFDEIQMLDIDTEVHLPDGYVQATGGGRYHLPIQHVKDAKVRVRHYLVKDETNGQARVDDWRLVTLMEGR